MTHLTFQNLRFAGYTALIGFMLAVFAPSSPAHAIKAVKKRLVMEGNQRTGKLIVFNNKDETQTYRLGWRRLRMTNTEALQQVPEGDEEPDLKPAKDFLRAAPRRFSIPPGEKQTIRLIARKPPDLEAGEYRSHLWVREEPGQQEFNREVETETGASIEVRMLGALTLPVIVRHGDTSAQAELKNMDVQANDENMDVSMELHRTGNQSLYGMLEFVCTNPEGKENVVKQSYGNAVYTEVEYRRINFSNIDYPGDQRAACQTLTVNYYKSESEDLMATTQSSVD